MTSDAALMREIRRISEDRDRLERRQTRIDTAIARAIAMLRDRPEHRIVDDQVSQRLHELADIA